MRLDLRFAESIQRLDLGFSEHNQSFDVDFGQTQHITERIVEDLDAVLIEQKELIAALQEVLKKKVAGGAMNYAKIIATTDSTTSFIIENPLGGIAKKVSIKAISPTITSSRKIHECCVDSDVQLGAVKAVASSGSANYVMSGTNSTPNNGQFRMTEDFITVYRFNSANTWHTACEYEVEIFQ